MDAITEPQLKSLLTEAIRSICTSNIGFDSQMKIEGLLAVTVDADKVFVVNLAEKLHEQADEENSIVASPLRDLSPNAIQSKPLVPMHSFRSPFQRQRGRRFGGSGSKRKRSHAEMSADDEEHTELPPPVTPPHKETPEHNMGCMSGGKLISSIASDLRSCLTPVSHTQFPLTSTPTDSPQYEALDLKVKHVRFERELAALPGTTSSPATCHVCGQTLSSKRNLELHLQRHYGIYQYTCEQCGEGFSSSTNLKGHQWKHTNVKDFKCDLCGAEFIYKINLKRHTQKKHPSVIGELSPE